MNSIRPEMNFPLCCIAISQAFAVGMGLPTFQICLVCSHMFTPLLHASVHSILESIVMINCSMFYTSLGVLHNNYLLCFDFYCNHDPKEKRDGGGN